ncbi:MAG: TIGR02757 family protein [Thermodesulfobacteriota bacterium]
MTRLARERERLEGLFARYHRRDLVDPDPLVFLYDYGDLRDREIAGLIASSLAYGRVRQIMASVASALAPMGPSPFRFLMESTGADLDGVYRHFRHRFTSGRDMVFLLKGARGAIEEHGSLHACFCKGLGPEDETVLTALSAFVAAFRPCTGECRKGFLPSPDEGSACKRWHLFLRWMVRRDEVDPGGWSGVPASKLVVPLDTHMHRIGLELGLTRRRQADQEAALEMTRAFREISPEDPVRYDFVLTRIGIRKDVKMS